jgi:hypothetical protein
LNKSLHKAICWHWTLIRLFVNRFSPRVPYCPDCDQHSCEINLLHRAHHHREPTSGICFLNLTYMCRNFFSFQRSYTLGHTALQKGMSPWVKMEN